MKAGRPVIFSADWTLGNLVFERAVLVANERVSFVAELVKVLVVRPHALREFILSDKARANHEGGDAALHAVLWRVLRQKRAVCSAPTDHAMTVHVCRRVARIHAAHVRAKRRRIPKRVHLFIIEVVISLKIGA